jgi:O-antigen/teichoic acid export membrane protein
MVAFGAPLVPVTLSFWVMTSSDRVVLDLLADHRELGLYAVAATVAAGFGVLLVAVGQAWSPRIMASHEADPAVAAQQTAGALHYLSLLLCLLAALLSALAPEVIAVVGSEAFSGAARVLPLLLLGAALYGTSVITPTGLILSHRTRTMASLSVAAAAVNLVAAVALVPAYGMNGAAAAAAVGFGLLTGSYHVQSQRAWRIPVRTSRVIGMFVLLVAATVVFARAVEWPLIGRVLTFAVVAAALVWMCGVTRSELARTVRGLLPTR